MPTRVLHIVPSYKPAVIYGGIIYSVAMLAERQVSLGAEVWVFTTTANGAEELSVPTGIPMEISGVRVVYFRRWTGDHTHFCPGLWRALWQQGPRFDVIYVHSWWNWVVFGAMLICRWRSLQTFFVPHGMLSPYTLRYSWRSGFQHTVGQWLLARARWIATTPQEEGELRALSPWQDILCLPNAVSLPEVLPSRALSVGEVVQLLYLSRLDPKKGFGLLLDALSELEAPLPWRLVVAGDITSAFGQRMQQLARQKGLSDCIEWRGWVTDEEKWCLLAQSDVLVLPSQNENFAVVVVEALAVGTSVLVSDQVGLSAYVKQWDAGWCAPLCRAAWRDQLRSALMDAAKRQRIREQMPDQVRRDFDATNIARQYLQAKEQRYVQVIFRKPSRHGHYSIERSFGALWPYWEAMADLRVQRVVAVAASRDFWPRVRIALQMRRLYAQVYHLSGDIYFAALFLPGRKTLLTIHDCGFMRHPHPVKRWLLAQLWLRWPVRHCRHVVTVSEATKAEVVRYTGCASTKVSVIPSAIPPHFRFCPKPFNAECPRILHIGSAPNKNLLRHIEALRGIPCVLHIVALIGPVERQRLEQCGVAFEHTPDLDEAAVVRAYEACDLLLFASTWEGFGMPILEAQTVGRPVVTAHGSSMPEVAGPEGACFVDPFDVASIRQGVLRVIQDAAYRAHLVQKGIQNVRRYRPSAIAQAYAEIYRKMAR